MKIDDLGQHLIDKHGFDIAYPGGTIDRVMEVEHAAAHAVGGTGGLPMTDLASVRTLESDEGG